MLFRFSRPGPVILIRAGVGFLLCDSARPVPPSRAFRPFLDGFARRLLDGRRRRGPRAPSRPAADHPGCPLPAIRLFSPFRSRPDSLKRGSKPCPRTTMARMGRLGTRGSESPREGVALRAGRATPCLYVVSLIVSLVAPRGRPASDRSRSAQARARRPSSRMRGEGQLRSRSAGACSSLAGRARRTSRTRAERARREAARRGAQGGRCPCGGGSRASSGAGQPSSLTYRTSGVAETKMREKLGAGWSAPCARKSTRP